MAQSTNEIYDQLVQHSREAAILTSVESLLSWDERTVMPDAAGPYRAEQMTLVAGMIHQQRTDPRIGDWLAELQDGPLTADPHSTTGATIRALKRQYDRR